MKPPAKKRKIKFVIYKLYIEPYIQISYVKKVYKQDKLFMEIHYLLVKTHTSAP